MYQNHSSKLSVEHALKPYPACKDSGVEWLGDVPAHWGIERLKSLMVGVVKNEYNVWIAAN